MSVKVPLFKGDLGGSPGIYTCERNSLLASINLAQCKKYCLRYIDSTDDIACPTIEIYL